jgi:hypothetical protein
MPFFLDAAPGTTRPDCTSKRPFVTTTTQLDSETERSCSATPEPSSSTNDAPPLRSVHTSNFSAILQELGVSVLVTTYQAGKLVMLRPDGDRLNTHFRGFSKPMGLAVDGDRLAIGTGVEIWEYHNAPAVARQLERGRHSRRLLLAALVGLHRRYPDSRDGLGQEL